MRVIDVVIGGASSGKSAYAERLLCAAQAREKWYLATMPAQGAEAARRIAHHRAMRAGKGFLTAECPRDIGGWDCPPDAAVLLECVTTLVANELFDENGLRESAQSDVVDGIAALAARAQTLILVTGDVLRDDALHFTSETMRYREVLGAVNRRLCMMAERVTEVVCGIALPRKGRVNK